VSYRADGPTPHVHHVAIAVTGDTKPRAMAAIVAPEVLVHPSVRCPAGCSVELRQRVAVQMRCVTYVPLGTGFDEAVVGKRRHAELGDRIAGYSAVEVVAKQPSDAVCARASNKR
jgi:hypothetical protein